MRKLTYLLLLIALPALCWALEPDQVMIIANGDNPDSVRLGQYYCRRRGVDSDNLLRLSLGSELRDSINRSDYDTQVVAPVRRALARQKQPGGIRCLLTLYGIPYKVGPRGHLPGRTSRLADLRKRIAEINERIEQFKLEGQTGSSEYSDERQQQRRILTEIKEITGKETGASLDSELSMVVSSDYDLFRWRPNSLQGLGIDTGSTALMVSRLDGPTYDIAAGLIDKAMRAERQGLKGVAYIDARGITKKDLFGHYDRQLLDLAARIERTGLMPVKLDNTSELFPVDSCPDTAIYCGWYSLANYVDAFDFVDGAIGYHIASFEGQQLRSPDANNWCPAMLRDGVTATLGPVAEPYLHSFPDPVSFFAFLFRGDCLVEAYYRTKPFNSWQLMLIGDPLYRPFPRN